MESPPSSSGLHPWRHRHQLERLAGSPDEQQQVRLRAGLPPPQLAVEQPQTLPQLPLGYHRAHPRAVVEQLRHGTVPRQPFDSHPALDPPPPLLPRQDGRR